MKNQQEKDSFWGSWSNQHDREHDRYNRWNQRNTYSRQDDDRFTSQNIPMGGGYTAYAGNINDYGPSNTNDRTHRDRGRYDTDYSYRHNQDWNRGVSNPPIDRNQMYNRDNKYRYNQGLDADQNNYRNQENSDWQNNSNSEWRTSNYDPYRINNRFGYNDSGENSYSNYGRYNPDPNRASRHNSTSDRWTDDKDRGFIDRAGDEVRSWFGDEEAEQRRRMDEQQERYRRNTSDRDWM